MNEINIVQEALDNLRETTGLKAVFKPIQGGTDGRLDFLFDNGNERFYVEVKKELRRHHLPLILEQAKIHQPLIVVAENIFPALKDELRKENIAYLDGAGNIYMRTPAQYIWVEGNKTVHIKDKERNRAFTKTGLKMVLYLLDHPEAINYPYRKLAEDAGVGLGNVALIIEGLREAGFILPLNDRMMMLQNKKALLERWITGYGELLKPGNFAGAYKFWKKGNIENWHTLEIQAGKTFWGGEPAAEFLTEYLNPAQLTVYTTEPKKLMKDWILLPQDDTEGANLLMYHKFWKVDHIGNENIAPIPIVYADLILTDDPRCLEAATMIYDKYLRNEFE